MTAEKLLTSAVSALRNEEITAETVSAAAEAISELTRYLNHATLAWSVNTALPLSADTARLIGALHETTQRLNQTLNQIGERIAAISHNREPAHRAVLELGLARDALEMVTRHLGQAHASAAQLPA